MAEGTPNRPNLRSNKLNEDIKETLSFSKCIETIRQNNEQMINYQQQIETRLSGMLGEFDQVNEELKTEITTLKNTNECLIYIKEFLDKFAALEKCQKIIIKQGFDFSHKREYFETVLYCKQTAEFYFANAPANPHFMEWVKLLNEAFNTLSKYFDSEHKNSQVNKDRRLITLVDKWISTGVYPQIQDTDINHLPSVSLNNMMEIAKVFTGCNEGERLTVVYADTRAELYKAYPSNNLEVKPFPLIRRRRSVTTKSPARIFRTKTLPEFDLPPTLANSPSSEMEQNYDLSYNQISTWLGSFILMLNNEVKYAQKLFPRPESDHIIQRVFDQVIDQLETILEIRDRKLRINVNESQLSHLIRIVEEPMNHLHFVYSFQAKLYSYSMKIECSHKVDKLYSAYQNLEKTVTDGVKSFLDKFGASTENMNQSGIFQTLVEAKQFYITFFRFKREMSYIYTKLLKPVRYVDYSPSWNSFLYIITSTSLNMIFSYVSKYNKTENFMNLPQQISTVLNNLEYILEILNIPDFIELTPPNTVTELIQRCESSISTLIERYLNHWLNQFQNIENSNKSLKQAKEESKIYGSVTGRKIRSTARASIILINEFMDENVKIHQELIFYKEEIKHSLKDALMSKVLPVYRDLCQLFEEFATPEIPKYKFTVKADEFSNFLNTLLKLDQD